MNTELFSQTSNQLGDMMVPARKFQGALVKHMERVADFQLHSLRNYSEMGMQQLRALQDVGDPQSFMSKNAEMLKALNENMSNDMNEFVKLQRSFAEDLQQLGKESADKASQMAEKTADQASRGMREAAEKGKEATGEAASSASSAAQETAETEEKGAERAARSSEKASTGSSSGKRSA